MNSKFSFPVVVAILVASLLNIIHTANGDQNIIISKGYVTKLCGDSCNQSTDKSEVEDCMRGCRFFEYGQSSNTVEANDTAYESLCVDSCKEAYTEGKNRDACVTGCNKARQEIDNIVQMGRQMLEEADKQMNFMNSIFDMMASTFWSTENSNEADEDANDAKMIGHLIDGNGQPKINQLDKQMDTGDVEILTWMGNSDGMPMDPAEANLCATRMWLHRLSFILIILGAMSLFLISFFYLVAVLKHKKQAKAAAELMVGDEPSANPPSYETLVKNGFIVVDPNDLVIAPVHQDKKEKLLN